LQHFYQIADIFLLFRRAWNSIFYQRWRDDKWYGFNRLVKI